MLFVKKYLPLFLLVCNLLVTISLLLSAWLPYLNPQQYWLSGFAGLFFLVSWHLNFAFIILWLIMRKRYYWIPLLGVVLSGNALYNSIGIHFSSTHPVSDPKKKQFTVMTFNTSNMGLKDYREDTALQLSIYNTLQQASPDILCMQEFLYQ